MATATLAQAIDLRIQDRLARRVGARKVELWFNGSAAMHLDTDAPQATLRVAVANRFVAKRFNGEVLQALQDAAQEELGQPVQVQIHVTTAADPASPGARGPSGPLPSMGVGSGGVGNGLQPVTPPADQSPTPTPHSHGSPAPRAPRPRGGPHPMANTGLVHRLEDFVTGSSNLLAYKACQQLAETLAAAHQPGQTSPATPPGPVFLHGGCGLGKTHLLQGTVRRLLERKPNAKVLYFTGEQFTNAFIQAVRNKNLDRFRKQMRDLDLLALDDVQFLSDKHGTQTEFLHCYDAIAQSGATILLASDEHPRRLQRFSPSLVSRFGHGLVVQVEPPDTATRRALVETFAARRGLLLSSGAIEALLPQAGPSVREAIGLLAKVQALAWYTADRAGHPTTDGVGLTISQSLVQRLLEAERAQTPHKPATFDLILAAVADTLGIAPEMITAGSRKRQAVLAREIVVRLARELRKMSYPEITLAMGRNGHSTVLNADKRFDQKLADPLPCPVPGCEDAHTVQDLYQHLRNRLTGQH